MAPQTDIMEQIICRSHYGRPESIGLDCKLEAIQTELAVVQEVRAALGQIPGILLALPYGVMADHYGRKAVFLLFLLGLVLSDTLVKLIYLFPGVLPLRLVWACPFLNIIGGGSQVGDFVICTIIADVVPSQERVGAFLKLAAIDLAAQIVATPLAAVMMRYSSWYPLALSSLLFVFGAFLATRLPETRPQFYKAVSLQEPEDSSECCDQTEGRSLLGEYRKFFGSMRSISTGSVTVLLFVFFMACFGTQSMQLLLQYASKKFSWDYSKASLLMTLRSIFHLALATVLMPLADAYIAQQRGLDALDKDTKLSQISGGLLFAGHLLLFLANNPTVLVSGLITTALGSSFLITLRSTLTSLVPATSVGALYAAVSIAHGLGIMVAGPLIALIFHWGMVIGNGWLGLPFLVTSLLHLLALMVMTCSTRMSGYRALLPNDRAE
ncbi:MFS general substrate transporter [Periconia macrospinosa]|uniref:MFS general substrate transporter n=1 Tax=Periconia macrospinosa TaxID=97972 RepID=A0A2V1DDS5_9PLEO|nr:MFS general substrate transporter [Periconia macrospinosa]